MFGGLGNHTYDYMHLRLWKIMNGQALKGRPASVIRKYDRRSQPTLSLISFEGSSEVLNSALSLKSEFLIFPPSHPGEAIEE